MPCVYTREQLDRRQAELSSHVCKLYDVKTPFAYLVPRNKLLMAAQPLGQSLLAQSQALTLGYKHSDELAIPLVLEALRQSRPLPYMMSALIEPLVLHTKSV